MEGKSAKRTRLIAMAASLTAIIACLALDRRKLLLIHLALDKSQSSSKCTIAKECYQLPAAFCLPIVFYSNCCKWRVELLNSSGSSSKASYRSDSASDKSTTSVRRRQLHVCCSCLFMCHVHVQIYASEHDNSNKTPCQQQQQVTAGCNE